MREKIGLFKLNENAMTDVKAGVVILDGDGHRCGCGCFYAGTPGGSSVKANMCANWEDDLYSPIV
jgi:hypothetical protein